MFVFEIKWKDCEATRRSVLSTIAGIFDPIGLIAPYVLTAKAILQGLCRKGMGWDTPLTGSDLAAWEEWKLRMSKVSVLKFPRWVLPEIVDEWESLQLHLFADASETGYGAAAYVRYTHRTKGPMVNLLTAKARVAPLKTVSIPRLELSAAVLAVRLYRHVMAEFHSKFERVIFWTDSMIVIKYLNNTTSRFSTYVANRVQEIIENSRPDQWRHVPSSDNLADLASRGMPKNSIEYELWM